MHRVFSSIMMKYNDFIVQEFAQLFQDEDFVAAFIAPSSIISFDLMIETDEKTLASTAPEY